MTVPTDLLECAAGLLRERWSRRPQVGLVLGSGLGCLVDAIEVEAVIDAREIPGLPSSTAIGHRGRFVCGLLSDVPVIVQDGRLHSYEGHEFATCAWPVRLMARLGIETLVVTNASGGVNPDYSHGDVMLIDDHINLMWGNPLIGPNDDRFGSRFPDMSAPYDRVLGERLISAANQTGWRIHRGVYLALAGPNYETAAEYRMVRTLGADVVGMSTVPEVLAARHAGVRVLGLSIVANVFRDVDPDGEVAPEETTGDAVVAQVAETAPRLGELLQQVICREWGGAGQGGEHSTEILEDSPVERPDSACCATLDAHAPSAALLTAAGRGAVAVIRVASNSDLGLAAIDRHFRAANGRSVEQQEIGTLCYGVWSDSGAAGESAVEAEDVVVCQTGSGVVEIHCHGGPAAIERILCQLERSGVRRADWRDQLLDLNGNEASPSGRTATIDVECFDAMTRATTERAALLLLRQSQGVLRAEIDSLLALAGEDRAAMVGWAGGDSRSEVARRLRSLLDRADFGIHLAEPWRVVLAGRPNVGKSTLLNALLGYSRAIVFDEPGTTRDVVTGETAFDGWPFSISDTAGVRETDSELEREGIRRTRRSISDADLVCLLLDTSARPTDEDRALLADLRAAVPDGKLLIVAHKSDRPDVWGDELPGDALPVSSTTGDGIDHLAAAIVERTVGKAPDAELAAPATRRQVLRLQEAFAAAELTDWARVIAVLKDCRDGYRPFAEGTL